MVACQGECHTAKQGQGCSTVVTWGPPAKLGPHDNDPLLLLRRGSFAPGGASRGHVIPRGGMQGGFGGQSRGSRPSDARFTRRY